MQKILESLHFCFVARRSLAITRILSLLVVLRAGLAQGQDSQFTFDATGNLTAQLPETVGLPQIVGQPRMQIVIPGANASFSVVLGDTRGVSYQWRFNGANITGASKDALLLTGVGAAQEGLYSVVLFNGSGSLTSAPAPLFIDSDADGLPDSWELAHFGNLSQTATGDFDGDGISNLDEFLEGTDPADASSVNFVLTILSDGGVVVKVPDRSSYTNGETVTLTARPYPPDTFHAWTGDLVTSAPTVVLSMTNNMTVFAHFLPVDFIWANVSSGDWNVATNWNPRLVPGPYDNVFIAKPVTVSLNISAECGELNLGSDLGPVTLTGAGNLTIHRTCRWTGGGMGGSGRTVIDTGATLSVSGSQPVALSGRTLENGGTILWVGTGDIAMLGGAVITNRPGALFDVRNAASLYQTFGPAARVDNSGTFRKSISLGATTVTAGIAFNNYGAVEIDSGEVALGGGGLNQSSITVAGGATLNLSGGVFTSSSSQNISGAGNLVVSGAAATLAGLVNLAGTNSFRGGVANLTGDYSCLDNRLEITGGTANFDGTGTVAPAVITLSGGSLGGADTVTVGTRMDWTGGGMIGTGRTLIPPGVTLMIANSNTLGLSSRTLENGGNVLWTGSGSFYFAGATITNRAGGLLEAQNASSLYLTSVPGSRFDNAGIFRKSLNPGTITFGAGIRFNNYAEVEIGIGGLTLAGGGLNEGSIAVPAGTTLNLAGADFSSSGSESISGGGNIVVSGAAATLAGLVNVSGTNTFLAGVANLTGTYICTNNTLVISGGTANFNGAGLVVPAILSLSAGVLGGVVPVTVGSAINWSGGAMTGSGVTRLPPGITLTLANSDAVTLSGGRTFENGGTVLWTGSGSIALLGAVITNRAGALFDAQGSGSIYVTIGGPSRIDNAGIFRKSNNAVNTVITGGISFNNYGTLNIQKGILSAGGGYSSAPTALLQSALGGVNAGADFGQLQVGGSASLNGALEVQLVDGFLPAANNSFTVLTAGSRIGAFSNFVFSSNVVSMQLSNTANSVIVRVTAITGSVSPVLLSPQLSGPNILLSWIAVSNTSYRVEFEPSLISTGWTALPGGVLATSNRASKLDPLTASNRFYRVRVLP